MVYQWKKGARVSGDATAIGREIESIGQAVDARAVVEKARDKSTALHGCFEWDDSIAAEEYRLKQARDVMAALVVTVEAPDAPEREVTVRAYEHVDLGPSAEPRMAYVPIKKALKAPDLREQVMARLRATVREAEETATRYEYLSTKFASARGHLAKARAAIEEA